jgi:serine/threonine protein kinase
MHRDIKAENLFVTDKWKVKLGDFGESRAILKLAEDSGTEKERDTAQWNQRMTVLGTVAYMAPELVNAQKQYTEAIDVYAMGITFWEIWTGKDPFAKENTFSLYQLIVQGARPDIPTTCPAGFKEVINTSWDTTADQRPSASIIVQKMGIIIDDFQAALSDAKDDMIPLQISTSKESKVQDSEGDVKYNFTPTASEGNDENSTDMSFQFDDMYSAGSTSASNESYANPLKRLFRKSFKKK